MADEIKLKKPEDFGNVEVFTRTEDDGTEYKAAHGSDLGREPEFIEEETFKPEERIDHERTPVKFIKNHKLNELSEEWYFFSLATVYWTIRSKESFDLIFQFGRDMQLSKVENVVTYK